jgi:hypothetical protein
MWNRDSPVSDVSLQQNKFASPSPPEKRDTKQDLLTKSCDNAAPVDAYNMDGYTINNAQ